MGVTINGGSSSHRPRVNVVNVQRDTVTVRQVVVHTAPAVTRNNLVVIDRPQRVIVGSTGRGMVGPIGPAGATGQPGGTLREVNYNFASPSLQWVVVHGLGTRAIEVNAFDLDGVTEKEANPVHTDLNTVVLDWYYPESGSVQLLY